MESVFNLQTLFPLSLILLQTIFVAVLSYLIIDWWKLIQRPLEGMEYGRVIICAGFTLSCLLISCSSVDGIYETFRNYVVQEKSWVPLVWAKFFQFMLVICTAELFFAGIVRMMLHVTFRKRTTDHASSDHLVSGLFTLSLIIGLAFILKSFAGNIISDLVPRFKAFNGF